MVRSEKWLGVIGGASPPISTSMSTSLEPVLKEAPRTADGRCCVLSVRPHERDSTSTGCAEARGPYGRAAHEAAHRRRRLPRHRGEPTRRNRGDTIILQAVVFDMQIDPRPQLHLGALKPLPHQTIPSALRDHHRGDTIPPLAQIGRIAKDMDMIPQQPSLSKATICGISPRCGVTAWWAAVAPRRGSCCAQHRERPSIHRFISSLLVSMTGSGVVYSHCETFLSCERMPLPSVSE